MSSDMFGTFSEPTSLSSGDPYKRPIDNKGRFGGKQFGIVTTKAGRSPDTYIDKQVRSLALGDRYVDAWILDKHLSKKPGTHLSEKPFYRSVGANSGNSYGPGTNNGCISKDTPFDTDGSAAAKRSNPPQRPADRLRNIYTSTPKKGGFGLPWKDRSIGEPPKYYMDVYDGGREKEKALRSTSRPVSSKPFVAAATPPRTFTSDNELYHRSAAAENKSSSGSSSSRSSSRSTSAPDDHPQRPQSAPWRPSSPPKQGAASCVLSHIGRNYMSDPVKEAKFHAKNSKPSQPFRPTSGSKARLSMWSPNPFATDPRPTPDVDFTIT